MVREFAQKNTSREETKYVHSILHQSHWIIGIRPLRNVNLKRVKCRKQQVGELQIFVADQPKE